MRLARTAPPLPRESGQQDSNLRLRRPRPVGCPLPYSQINVRSAPPAGLEPAASGLRARRHRRFRPRGHESSGGRARTCALAINSRASYRLDHAGTNLGRAALPAPPCFTERKERESNPQGPAGPPVFETGYRAGGSPSEGGPGRRRTCNPPLKRRELCRFELRSLDVTGRDRTCDAPRFRRALYRAELRSRVKQGRSRSRTGGLLRIRKVLCHLSYPPSGRGWARTSSLLRVRQALSRLSYSPSSGPEGSRTPRTTAPFAEATTTARLLCRTLSWPFPSSCREVSAGSARPAESRLSVHARRRASTQ